MKIFRQHELPPRMPNHVPLEIFKSHTRQHFTDGLWIGFACGAIGGVLVAFFLIKLMS